MKYTRITSYYGNGEFTGCEHIYARDQSEAVKWFREDYPAHNNCLIIAEDYDPNENPDHFRACSDCGCVHYWK